MVSLNVLASYDALASRALDWAVSCTLGEALYLVSDGPTPTDGLFDPFEELHDRSRRAWAIVAQVLFARRLLVRVGAPLKVVAAFLPSRLEVYFARDQVVLALYSFDVSWEGPCFDLTYEVPL